MKPYYLIPLLALLCACQPAPTESTESASQSYSAPSFVLGDVAFEETDISGCSVTLQQKDAGPNRYVFLFGSEDEAAKGFLRLDGKIVTVTRSASTFDEAKASGQDAFASQDGEVRVVYDYTLGESSEAIDGAKLTGTVTITGFGGLQTVSVTGTSAC